MLKTVQGYPVHDLGNAVIVSVEEGKRIRAADLRADKSRRWMLTAKPYVNPETYTDEERIYMEE